MTALLEEFRGLEVCMKENWIEDVLNDLSKSALNEGRFELFNVLNDFVKVASRNRIVDCNEIDGKMDRQKIHSKPAEIIDIYEYRHRKLIKLKM